MKDLLKAEESKNNFLILESQATKRILFQGGISFQTHAFSYDDPTEDLRKHFEDFLIRSVIAIRKVVKIAEVIFSKTFKGPENLKKYLKSVFHDMSPEMKMVDEDSIWMKELYNLRGEAEHDQLGLEPFELEILPDGKPLIKPMRLSRNGVPISEYLEVTLDNCFTFCEDMTVMFLNTKCTEMVQIVLIPENLRSKYRDFKYMVDLKGEYKRKFHESVEKQEV